MSAVSRDGSETDSVISSRLHRSTDIQANRPVGFRSLRRAVENRSRSGPRMG